MAAMKGRDVLVKLNGTAIAGVRTKSVTIGGAPIDITTDDDGAVRKLMDEPGQVDVSISVAGLTTSAASALALRTLAMNRTDRVNPMQFSFGGSPDNGFQGQFFMSNYTESGEYQGAVSFEAEFQSADTITYA